MTTYIETDKLPDVADDTLVVSANGEWWIVGVNPETGWRALIPVPRQPIGEWVRRSWLYFNRHTEVIQAKAPWRLAVEPQTVSAEELATEPIRTVVLDRYCEAWQLFEDEHGTRELTRVSGPSFRLDARTFERADDRHGPFTIIFKPGVTFGPGTVPTYPHEESHV